MQQKKRPDNRRPAGNRDYIKDFLQWFSGVELKVSIIIPMTFVLLLIFKLIDSLIINKTLENILIIPFQAVIFLLPALLFARIRAPKDPTRYLLSLRVRPPRAYQIPLMLSSLALIICGTMLTSLFFAGTDSMESGFSLYSTFVSRVGGFFSSLFLIVAYCIVPAFCEELVFRGILCAEHEKHGILYAAAVSSVFFAFLHFDLTALPVYLFAGTLLAVVTYVTRSAIAAMVVHLCYNLFGIFVQAGLSGYCRSTGSIGLLVVLLVALLLLSSAFFCGEVARVLRRRAHADLLDDPEEISTPGLNRIPLRRWPRALLTAFASPAGVAAVVLWLFGVVVNLVR